MTQTDQSDTRDERLDRLAESIEVQPADFLWIDMCVPESDDLRASKESKFGKIMKGSRQAIPMEGFGWIEPPQSFRTAIDLARAELRKAHSSSERRALMASLLFDPDPPLLRKLSVS